MISNLCSTIASYLRATALAHPEHVWAGDGQQITARDQGYGQQTNDWAAEGT